MLDLDPTSLRDWMAAVGLLRLVSETSEKGRLLWLLDRGRYRLEGRDVPNDLAERGADWIEAHKSEWSFAGQKNVNFPAATWRHAAASAQGLEAAMWCAVGSDAVMHRSGSKVQASGLEYGHGGGHQHWLASMRDFLNGAVKAEHLTRILSGGRDERMKGPICRWDPECERNHAYRAIAPTDDKPTQDQTINALAAIGLASCPSAPTQRGLLTPLVDGNALFWPVWLDELRLADLEAALCCGWMWPTMRGRRWLSGKLYCFSRGELCEPLASPI
ncbi:MAG: hypothetical protein KDB18_09665 [Salinibacterium sp.]|nr:hypothetical protein [Salinibacterium sp.]